MCMDVFNVCEYSFAGAGRAQYRVCQANKNVLQHAVSEGVYVCAYVCVAD